MKKLAPLLLALLGTSAGVGAGLAMRPEHTEIIAINPCGTNEETPHDEAHNTAPPETVNPEENTDSDYVKLNNQFVVSVVEGGKIAALVVMSLSMEVVPGTAEAVFEQEPKLRDVFLQVMFEHSNAGGFSTEYTNTSNMILLRDALRETARRTMGATVRDVLIQDFVRQDI